MGPSNVSVRARGRVAERPRVVLIGAALLVAALACGDPYVHTNPYDPAVPVEFSITGPDTLFSYAELAQFTAATSPAFPDSAITWTVDSVTVPDGRQFVRMIDTIVDGGLFLKPSGTGTFQSIAPPLEPTTLTIAVGASIGRIDTTVSRMYMGVQTTQFRHSGYKSVVVTQRLTSIQLLCPNSHACDPVAAGGSWSVFVNGFDALGHGVFATSNIAGYPRSNTPAATLAVRDSTIASVLPVGIRNGTVTALKNGSTWLVAIRGLLADSLQLVVR